MARYPIDVQEYAMMIWSQEGSSFAEIARRVKAEYNISVTGNTIATWKANSVPMNWDEWKGKYRARLAQKQIEEVSSEALKATERVRQALLYQIRVGLAEIERSQTGEGARAKSLEGVMRELRETLEMYHRLFSMPDSRVQEIMAPLSSAEQLEVEALLAAEVSRDDLN